VLAILTSEVCIAHSTRLRLVGGSSSYSGRFCRAYVLITFLEYCQCGCLVDLSLLTLLEQKPLLHWAVTDCKNDCPVKCPTRHAIHAI
jgi:hypothetical protein